MMLVQPSSLEVVGAQLQHILASILATLQSSTPLPSSTLLTPLKPGTRAVPEAQGAEEPLVNLVLTLTVRAPPGLRVYLRDVEPLLPLPALEAACR